MRSGIIAIVFLIVIGVIIANIITNPGGTKVVFDGIGNLWSTSINGLLANGSKGGQ